MPKTTGDILFLSWCDTVSDVERKHAYKSAQHSVLAQFATSFDRFSQAIDEHRLYRFVWGLQCGGTMNAESIQSFVRELARCEWFWHAFRSRERQWPLFVTGNPIVNLFQMAERHFAQHFIRELVHQASMWQIQIELFDWNDLMLMMNSGIRDSLPFLLVLSDYLLEKGHSAFNIANIIHWLTTSFREGITSFQLLLHLKVDTRDLECRGAISYIMIDRVLKKNIQQSYGQAWKHLHKFITEVPQRTRRREPQHATEKQLLLYMIKILDRLQEETRTIQAHFTVCWTISFQQGQSLIFEYLDI